MEEKCYTTVQAAYDYLVKNYQRTGKLMSFPGTIDALKTEGQLMKNMPDDPTFKPGMSVEEFIGFLGKMRVYADNIIPQAANYMSNPIMEEAAMFPAGKDVFCIMDMPYMVTNPHYHDFFEITYVLRGQCTFLFEGETAPLYEGDLCIVSPMSGHSLPLNPGCVAVSVVVRRSTFDSVFGNLLAKKDLLSLFFRNSLYETRRANYILLKTGNDPMTANTVKELCYECNLVDEDANTCAVSLLNLFLARALRAANAAVTLHHYEGYSERDFNFTLVLQYIQKNYRTVTLSSLAQAFHFSETYLSKLIRKKMNQSFTDVLRTLKMNHALELLTNTSMKVSEIADAVGYDSVDHFSRTFRKTFGVPPQEYKKRDLAQLIEHNSDE